MGTILRRLRTIRAIEIILISVMILMAAAVSISVYSYVKLQQSWPLEDFTGYVISPVDIGNDTVIRTDGTYTRTVQCDMYDFNIQLRNAATKDIVVLTKEHLAKAPKASMTPGNDIQVEFELFIPSNLYEGWWTPTFTGNYWCRNGIFTANKIQAVTVASFEVIDSTK